MEVGYFDDMPKDVKTRYNEWRAKEKECLKSREYQVKMRDLTKEAEAFVEDMSEKVAEVKKDKPTQEERCALIRKLTGEKYTQDTLRKIVKICAGEDV